MAARPVESTVIRLEDGMDWNYDNEPTVAGWYAVLVCYDPQEGIFPMGAWWNGATWQQKGVVAFGDMRLTKQEAEALAYEHDPDA
jgi:hypothetical protein